MERTKRRRQKEGRWRENSVEYMQTLINGGAYSEYEEYYGEMRKS